MSVKDITALNQAFVYGSGQVVDTGMPGAVTRKEILDVLDSANRGATATISEPGGIKQMSIYFVTTAGTPTATKGYVVFDALNDDDATAKLNVPGDRSLVPLDYPTVLHVIFPDGAKPLRADFASDAATEVGSTILYVEYTT